jgi:Tol biopolymer transport system component
VGFQSPDGRAVAFGSANGETGRVEIAVTDLARSVTTKVVFGPGRFSNPVWSPDGKRLAYRAYGRAMMEKNADGTGAERQLYSRDAIPLSYSPDGKYLLYQSRSQFYLLSLGTDGSSIPINPGKATARDAAISADGKFIAYTSSESGSNEVYVEPMPPGAGRWQISKGSGGSPRWRKDGKEIFFDDASGQIFAVDVLPGPGFSVGPPKVLLAPGTSNGDFDVSADGQRFLVGTRGGSAGNVPINVVQNWWLELEKK